MSAAPRRNSPVEPEHHGRDDVERHEHEHRDRGEAGAPAPRPERQQRGDDHQERPAGADHRPRPLVQAAVRHAHAGKRLDPPPHAGHQRAPAVGAQVLVGDAARQQGERDRAERGERGGERAQRPVQARRAEQRGHEQRDDAHRLPGARRGGGLEQPHPVQAGERREGDQHQPADGPERQCEAARGVRADHGGRRRCRERAQAAAPRSRVPVMPRRPPRPSPPRCRSGRRRSPGSRRPRARRGAPRSRPG